MGMHTKGVQTKRTFSQEMEYICHFRSSANTRYPLHLRRIQQKDDRQTAYYCQMVVLSSGLVGQQLGREQP
jgi:hypothetical protein